MTTVLAAVFPVGISIFEAPMAAVTDANEISEMGARFRIILQM